MLNTNAFLSNAARRRGFRGVIATATIAVATCAAATPALAAGADADPGFRSLFMSWKKQDVPASATVQATASTIAVPSLKPVTLTTFSSGFGVRVDPFRRTAAMHAGVDMPGPQGTPIYATADGVVDYAEWMNGYGNLVEIEHGKGLSTRYGHLSKIVVANGQHVHRGELIALMGSTGRSTGSHLHYEVRIDGRAVNPIPFLENIDYADATRKGLPVAQIAMSGSAAVGGPEE